jgi:type III secretory pathway component EscR
MKTTATCIMLLAFLGLLNQSLKIEAFSSTGLGASAGVMTNSPVFLNRHQRRHHTIVPSLVVVKNSASEEDNEKAATTDGGEKKMSLEEKMKNWEATEEEIKAATLGGIVPQQRERTEAFDVGLYIAFPLMVVSLLAFAIFPLIMGNIDLGDLEVPRV